MRNDDQKSTQRNIIEPHFLLISCLVHFFFIRTWSTWPVSTFDSAFFFALIYIILTLSIKILFVILFVVFVRCNAAAAAGLCILFKFLLAFAQRKYKFFNIFITFRMCTYLVETRRARLYSSYTAHIKMEIYSA